MATQNNDFNANCPTCGFTAVSADSPADDVWQFGQGRKATATSSNSKADALHRFDYAVDKCSQKAFFCFPSTGTLRAECRIYDVRVARFRKLASFAKNIASSVDSAKW